MKKAYNQAVCAVIMKPTHTEYYWGGWSKSKYDEYGRNQIVYSSTGLSWKFEYNDKDKTLQIATEKGYTYSVKYDK